MALWQENFDFYEARAREGRAFISVDLAAKQHAPSQRLCCCRLRT
jgi:hypothetical protein